MNGHKAAQHQKISSRSHRRTARKCLTSESLWRKGIGGWPEAPEELIGRDCSRATLQDQTGLSGVSWAVEESGFGGRTLMANNGWRLALASRDPRRLRRWSYGNEMRCAPAERSHLHARGRRNPGVVTPRYIPRLLRSSSRWRLRRAARAFVACVVARAVAFRSIRGTRAIQPAGCGAPRSSFSSLRGLRDLRGFIAHTKSVPKFRTSRLPLAQVKFHAHKRPDRRTECRDARTSRRTRAQIVGTPAQTLRTVAQSQR